MSDALREHNGKFSYTNLWSGINALAEEEQELETLAESLCKTCRRFKMEADGEKTKLMTNSVKGIQREINVNGHKGGLVPSLKYLRAIVSDNCLKTEVLKEGLHMPLKRYLES